MKGEKLLLPLIFLFIGSMMAHAQVSLPQGYESFSLPIASAPEGAALAPDPTNPWLFYVAIGGWGPHEIYKVQIVDEQPVVSTFASGAFSLSSSTGDDALDSLFGTVGGLAVLATGELIIIDNYEQSGVPGDTIFLARDLNADGDARDIIVYDATTTASEVIELIEPINTLPGSGWGGFTGQQAEVGENDAIYVVTADGGTEGEVLVVSNPLSSPAITSYYEGLSYGAGIDFDSEGRLLVGNSVWPNPSAIIRLQDLNDDDDAQDVGESEYLSTGTLPGIYDLALDSEDRLFSSYWNTVYLINEPTGTPQPFASFADPFVWLGDIILLNGHQSFRPNTSGSPAWMVIADGNGDGALTVIRPVSPSRAASWTRYE